MADFSIVGDLILDANGAVVGSRKASAAVRDVGTAGTKTSGVMGKLGGALKALPFAAAVSGAAALMGAFRLLSESVRLAGVQQIAERRLGQALRNLGEQDVPAAVAGLKDVASEIQRTSNYGDELTLTAGAVLASFKSVGGAEGIGQLLPRLADMAAGVAKATGESVDLNQVAIAVGKSLDGGATALKRYGVSIDAATAAQIDAADGMEKINLLTKVLDDNFQGLAKAGADPFKQLGNAVGDLKESLGMGLRGVLSELAADLTRLAQDREFIAMVQRVGEGIALAAKITVQFIRTTATMVQGLSLAVRGFDSAEKGNKRFRLGLSRTLAMVKDLATALRLLSDAALWMRKLELETSLAGERARAEGGWMNRLFGTDADAAADNIGLIQKELNEVNGALGANKKAADDLDRALSNLGREAGNLTEGLDDTDGAAAALADQADLLSAQADGAATASNGLATATRRASEAGREQASTALSQEDALRGISVEATRLSARLADLKRNLDAIAAAQAGVAQDEMQIEALEAYVDAKATLTALQRTDLAALVEIRRETEAMENAAARMLEAVNAEFERTIRLAREATAAKNLPGVSVGTLNPTIDAGGLDTSRADGAFAEAMQAEVEAIEDGITNVYAKLDKLSVTFGATLQRSFREISDALSGILGNIGQGLDLLTGFAEVAARDAARRAQESAQAAGQAYQDAERLGTEAAWARSEAADEIAARDDERARRAFEHQKNAALAAAIVHGLAATVRAFADYPFPASLAVAALAAGSTALQIAQIRSQQYGGSGSVSRPAASAGAGTAAGPAGIYVAGGQTTGPAPPQVNVGGPQITVVSEYDINTHIEVEDERRAQIARTRGTRTSN